MKNACNKILVLTLCLAGCGGGAEAPRDEAPPPASVSVSGRATKGPLSSATVALFSVDGRGNSVGMAIATTVTDVAGNWTFSLPEDHPAYLVEVSGGRFVDESDADTDTPRVIELAAGDTLLSILPAGEQTAAVTLFTHALVNKSRLESSDDDFLAIVASNQAQLTGVLGVDPLLTRSADPLAPVGTPQEQRYALIAGGTAYALNAVAIAAGRAAADFDTIELFARDLVDCQFDGRGIGDQFLYDFAPFGERTLNDDILRFRNNNFSAYEGVSIPRLPDAGCAVTPGTRDNTPPEFVEVSGPLVVAADDAAGVVVENSAIEQALALFIATDDRDDAPVVEALLPATIALGRNEIAVVASDAWGNRTELVWVIEVRDLTPPLIAAPVDITVAASAALTQVVLGEPDFSDNVSSDNALIVSNDAPADGFEVGNHLVNWQVRDEAGLINRDQQRVVVTGLAPVQLAPLAPLVVTEGAAVSFELAAFFEDPLAAPLRYSLSGLPGGTGLALDAGTGRVSGLPGAADLAAQPLTLSVGVSNGPFEIVATWSLLVQPSVPVFSLPEPELTLDEDFAEVVMVGVVPSFTVVSGGPVVFSLAQDSGDPMLLDVSIDPAGGAVMLTSVRDRFGSARYRITASNAQNGASFDATLDVSVAAVNDAPQAQISGDEVTATAEEDFELSIGDRFSDVDDLALSYRVEGAPRGFALTSGDLLGGVAQAVAAAGGVYRTTITATDAAGLQAVSSLDIVVVERDTDGDGLSDAFEQTIGTNADQADSDGDGVDDGVEVAAGADPLLPATGTIYLSTSGSDTNGGTSFADALRSHAGIAAIAPGISRAQPTFILYAADDEATYGGVLTLQSPCDNIVLAGSIDAAAGVTRLGPGGSPGSRLNADSATPLVVTDCLDVTLVNIAIVDNKQTGMRVNGARVFMQNVHLRGNFSELGGAGLAIDSGSVFFSGGLIAANESRKSGGGVAIAGAGAELVIRDSLLSGNFAAVDGGAVYFDSPDGRIELFNNLLTANSAMRGGGVFAAGAGLASLASNTMAFNQRRGPGAGAALDYAAGVAMSLTDSILWFNRDAVLGNSLLPVGLASSFNSIEQPALGPGDLDLGLSGPGFGIGFGVTTASQAIDLGSALASDMALDDRFAESGSPYPDEGTLDRGYHYPTGLSTPPLVADELGAVFHVSRAPSAAFARYRRLTVTPRVGDRPLGPGHRVRIAAPGARSILTNTVNVFAGSGDVQATDLGNGDYQVWIDVRETGHDTFCLTIDDVAVTIFVVTQCVVGGCDMTATQAPYLAPSAEPVG